MKEEIDILLYMGCMIRLRLPSIRDAVLRVLRAGQAKFKLLEDEVCCGDLLFLMGRREEAEKVAQRLMSKIMDAHVDTIVTPCAGCYRALTREYPNLFDFNLNVLHLSEYLAYLIRDGKLSFKEGNKIRVSYHDPCELGRHCGVYEAPREVIKALPGIELVEAEASKEDSRCCGGGGGVLLSYPELSIAGAYNRIMRDIMPLNVQALVTACPACYISFSYAIERYELNLKLYDLAELVSLYI